MKGIPMDLYCPKCGEPLDNDCLHDEADEQGKTYREVLRDFQSRGCEALVTYGKGDGGHWQPVGGERASVMAAMFDLLGDDADGAAAMMEDWEAGY
jgi:hypothetical protein